MQSFGNLGYTLGGGLSQGAGTASYGYNPSANNCPPGDNRSAYNHGRLYNGQGGQMPGQVTRTDNNNVHMSLYGNNGIPGNQRHFERQNPLQQYPAMHHQYPGQLRQIPQYNQQPVTSSGTSSFKFRDSYDMPPQPNLQTQQQHPFFSNNQENNNGGRQYGQGAANFTPDQTNNLFRNGVFPDEKPLGCHVKVGNAGDQPVVYCGYHDDQTVNKNNIHAQDNQSQGQQNTFDHSAMIQKQQMQQQSIQQQQIQQQQPQQMSMPCPIPNMNYVQNTPGFGGQQQSMNNNNLQHGYGGQPMTEGVPMQMPNNNSSNIKNLSFTPCGCCQACRFNTNNGQRNPGNPNLVRGLNRTRRLPMTTTTSAPQISGPQRQPVPPNPMPLPQNFNGQHIAS